MDIKRLMYLADLPPDEYENEMKSFRSKRVANKAIENQGKPPLVSPDVLDADDFTFEPFAQRRGDNGDSGSLLLATHKSNPAHKYIVKHAFCDCAANEYVYSKLVRAMGLKMPAVKLFRLSDPLDDTLFGTEYVCGIEYLNVVDADPSLEVIGRAKNTDDYYMFHTLYMMFREGDIVQAVLADDGYIYRIDCSDAFAIDHMTLMIAGVDDANGGSGNLTTGLSRLWNPPDMHETIRQYVNIYGEDRIPALTDPLFAVQQIRKPYIDQFLNTLCYFYPDHIGEYYSRFLTEMKKSMKRFVNLIS